MSAAIQTIEQLPDDGWLASAERRLSPNCDARPDGVIPDLLVVHAISLPVGEFTSATNANVSDLFLNQLDTSAHPGLVDLAGLRVSAHFFIQRDGHLTQFVSTEQRAWHAGVSTFLGRERCNDFSIGIEMEGSDFVPFEAAQYDTLTRLTASLCQHYPIQHVVGHQDIAPSRKTDPGPFFDWTVFQNLLFTRFQLVLANAAIRFHS
jgi:AmpD protein